MRLVTDTPRTPPKKHALSLDAIAEQLAPEGLRSRVPPEQLSTSAPLARDRETPAVRARIIVPESARDDAETPRAPRDRDEIRATRPVQPPPDIAGVRSAHSPVEIEHEGAPADTAARSGSRVRPTVPMNEAARTAGAASVDPTAVSGARPIEPRSRPRPTLRATAIDQPTPPASLPVDIVPGSVVPLVIESSAFGKAPWWSRGWWRHPPNGRARDLACDAGTSGSLATLAVSLRGNKHRLDAAPNDDAFAARVVVVDGETSWFIGCVCDGVGSASRAHEGSAFMAEHVAEALASLCSMPGWNDAEPALELIESAITTARAALAEHFGLDSGERDQLAPFETTLTFAMVPTTVEANGARSALIGHIGDSPALLLNDGTWSDLFATGADDATGVTSTRTAGVLTHPRLEGFRSFTLGPEDVLMLCSDGIGSFMTDGERDLQLGQVLSERFSAPVDVLEGVNLLSFDMRSADDDRTALVVWQLPDGDPATGSASR